MNESERTMKYFILFSVGAAILLPLSAEIYANLSRAVATVIVLGLAVGAGVRFGLLPPKKALLGCTAFLLSDMLDVDAEGNPRYEDALKVARGRHDLSVIKVHDPRERTLPALGLVRVTDPETGASAWVDTGRRKMRAAYSAWFRNVEEKERKLFGKYRVDSVDLATDQDYVRGLMAFFGGKS